MIDPTFQNCKLKHPLFTCLLTVLGLLSFMCKTHGQEQQYSHNLTLEYYKGFVFKHSSEVAHLIVSQPEGFVLQYDKHTYGHRKWEYEYRYPDVGYTLIYIDYNNPVLGKSIAPMAHFNYYFNRNRDKHHDFKFKFAFGPAFHSKPYDRETNNKNNFIGSTFTFGMQMQFSYNRDLSDKLAVKSGLSLTHFSNASISKPNKGINIIAANLGLVYKIDDKLNERVSYEKEDFSNRPVKYNVCISGGWSESLKEGNGVFPFFVLNTYADKRISRKSAFSVGLDYFVSYSLREEALFDPNLRGQPKPDFKRAGIALGYELFWHELSFLFQYGHYFYRPYERFKSKYQRLGLKYYLNEKLFVSFMLKTHLQKAEAGEFGLGWRL
ncbi:MAG: acyloxyacyl hydrolase [Cyclobacteriaceae bacterium]